MELNEKKDLEKLYDFKKLFEIIYKVNDPNQDSYMKKIIDGIFLELKEEYYEFKDSMPFIPEYVEFDKLNLLTPINGQYSLMDFLLNRLCKRIAYISITKDENAFGTTDGEGNRNTLYINKSRYDKLYRKIDKNGKRLISDEMIEKNKLKSIMHETTHILESNQYKCTGKMFIVDNFHLIKQLLGKYNIISSINELTKTRIPSFGKAGEFVTERNAIKHSKINDIYREEIKKKEFFDYVFYKTMRYSDENDYYWNSKPNFDNAYVSYRHTIPYEVIFDKKVFFAIRFGLCEQGEVFAKEYGNIMSKYFKNATITEVLYHLYYYQNDVSTELMMERMMYEIYESKLKTIKTLKELKEFKLNFSEYFDSLIRNYDYKNKIWDNKDNVNLFKNLYTEIKNKEEELSKNGENDKIFNQDNNLQIFVFAFKSGKEEKNYTVFKRKNGQYKVNESYRFKNVKVDESYQFKYKKVCYVQKTFLNPDQDEFSKKLEKYLNSLPSSFLSNQDGEIYIGTLIKRIYPEIYDITPCYYNMLNYIDSNSKFYGIPNFNENKAKFGLNSLLLTSRDLAEYVKKCILIDNPQLNNEDIQLDGNDIYVYEKNIKINEDDLPIDYTTYHKKDLLEITNDKISIKIFENCPKKTFPKK